MIACGADLRRGADLRMCPRLRWVLGNKCRPRGLCLRGVKFRLGKRTYFVVRPPDFHYAEL